MAPATERPGFLFLACPDTRILQEEIERLAKVYAPADGPFKRLVFWGDEPATNAFWEALSLRDLFGSVRLVIVRQANLWPSATWKMLDRILARPVTGSFPLFCLENDWDKTYKLPQAAAKLRCVDFARKHKWFWEEPGITDRTVRRYVEAQAKERGLKLAPQTLAVLCENTPKQAGVIANELDKLALLYDGTTPVPPQFLDTAEWSAEPQIFNCLNALFRGDRKKAWQEFARIEDMDTQALAFTGMLSWYLRSFWQLMAGDPRGGYFAFKPEQARRFGARRLARAMNLVMDAETAIKTGRPQRQTMELTFADLSDLFAGVK